MNVQFLETNNFANGKSLAKMLIDEQQVQIYFWSELADQWGIDGLKMYLTAEGLKQLNRLEDAHKLLSVTAKGELMRYEQGHFTDNRNWQQNWIDNHPLPKKITL